MKLFSMGINGCLVNWKENETPATDAITVALDSASMMEVLLVCAMGLVASYDGCMTLLRGFTTAPTFFGSYAVVIVDLKIFG